MERKGLKAVLMDPLLLMKVEDLERGISRILTSIWTDKGIEF